MEKGRESPKEEKKVFSLSNAKRAGILELEHVDQFKNWVKEQKNLKIIEEFTLEKISSKLQNADVDAMFEGLEQLTNLKQLFLKNLQLTKIPKQVFQLKTLTELHLSGNKISAIPSEVENLQNLEFFDLVENQVSELPEELFKLYKLKCLMLDRNNISKIPSEIGQLRLLEEIGLQYNPLTIVPAAVATLPNLKVLRVVFLQVVLLILMLTVDYRILPSLFITIMTLSTKINASRVACHMQI